MLVCIWFYGDNIVLKNALKYNFQYKSVDIYLIELAQNSFLFPLIYSCIQVFN